MHYSVCMAKVTGNFIPCRVLPEKNAKLKCSEISTVQNRQLKMQLKYSVLQYHVHSMFKVCTVQMMNIEI